MPRGADVAIADVAAADVAAADVGGCCRRGTQGAGPGRWKGLRLRGIQWKSHRLKRCSIER